MNLTLIQKKILAGIVGIAALGAGFWWIRHDAHKNFPGPQENVDSAAPENIPPPFALLMISPEGTQIPIGTEGITVMFNRAIVPLTALAKDETTSPVPLQITPPIFGTYHFLGTHGFIFRPDHPFAAATTYHVSLPSPITSVEHDTLTENIAWDFSTTRPKIIAWSPYGSGGSLLPAHPFVQITFNMAMDRVDVAKHLHLTVDEKTLPIQLTWRDNDHIAAVKFPKSLPWDAEINLSLDPGTRSKYGDLTTAAVATAKYSTPEASFTLDDVKVRPSDPRLTTFTLEPNTATDIPMFAPVCFSFSGGIDLKSFQKSLHVTAGKSLSSKPPRAFGWSTEYFSYTEPDGHEHEVTGYSEICVDGMPTYAEEYRITLQPNLIQGITGAKFDGKVATYIVRTPHAKPALVSNVTHNLLAAQGPMPLPYGTTNVSKLTVRVYPFPEKERFEESITNDSLVQDYTFDKTLKIYTEEPLADTLTLDGGTKLELDPTTHAIDQTKMHAMITHEIPLEHESDHYTVTTIDLAHLGTHDALAPGLYLIEVLGHPVKDTGKAPLPVYTAVQVTPIAIAIKDDVDRDLMWATDIETGAPIPNLTLDLFNVHESVQGATPVWEKTGTVTTNIDGVALLDSMTVDCAQVAESAKFSLSCRNWHTLPDPSAPAKSTPSEYDEYDGTENHTRMSSSWNYFAYPYTDRPIYRPGQTVYYSSFIRHVAEGRYFAPVDADGKNITAQVTVNDASGKSLHERKEVPIDHSGVVSGSFTLDDDATAARGAYSLTVTVDGQQSFTRTFYVASYRKPAFKVDLRGAAKSIVNQTPLEMTVNAAYLFGMPLRKSGVSWSIMTSTYLFAPDGYSGFSFVDGDLVRTMRDDDGHAHYESDYEYDEVASSGGAPNSWHSEEDSFEEDPKKPHSDRVPSHFFKEANGERLQRKETLDEQGNYTIQYKPNLQKYPTSQLLTVEASVQDLSHQQVSASEEIVVHKADVYVGIHPTKWAFGEHEDSTYDVVTLTTDGKPAPNQAVRWSAVRREWHYIERHTASGKWESVWGPQDTELASESVTTDENGAAKIIFTIPQGGDYRIVAHAQDARGNSAQAATEVYAWGEGYVPWHLNDVQHLELVPDKSSYAIGDTAKILVKSLVPITKALLTFERGRVLEYKIIELGGNADHIEIPITEGMIPNIFVNVTAHTGRADGHTPLLFTGEAALRVAPETKRLTVEITPDRKGEEKNPAHYGPGDTVKIKIHTQDHTGKAVASHVIVSVADEAVLRLVGYQLPDLVEKWYYPRKNSVESSSSMMSLKAGDGGLAAGKMRRVFRDTADFQAHLTTNAKGDADFEFKLPDDLTTWTIEALAASDPLTQENFDDMRGKEKSTTATGQVAVESNLALSDHHYVGSARASIMTTKPVLLRTAFPRFLVWGDHVNGRVLLANTEGKPVSGTLHLQVAGDAQFAGTTPTTHDEKFHIDARSETAIPIALNVDHEGSAKLTATLNDANGKPLDGLEISLPVLDRYMPEVVATAGTVINRALEKIAAPADALTDRGGLEVNTRASIALAIAPHLAGLISYPYGCAEQQSSRLIALLLARQMVGQYGETLYDAIASYHLAKDLQKIPLWDLKKKKLDALIAHTIEDLTTFQHTNGGIGYWKDSGYASVRVSAQTFWAWHLAQSLQYDIPQSAIAHIPDYLTHELDRPETDVYRASREDRIFALWALSLENNWHAPTADEAAKNLDTLPVQSLAYYVMALVNHGDNASVVPVADRLRALATHTPRGTEWGVTHNYSVWENTTTSTAFAANALFARNPHDELVPRALTTLLYQRKNRDYVMTQENLAIAWLLYNVTNTFRENETDYTAKIALGGNTLLEKHLTTSDLFTSQHANATMEQITSAAANPAPLTIAKDGKGTLYYDLRFTYYRPLDQTPPREEGLMITRNYYALNDVAEKTPLTEFVAGENYKAHVVVVVPAPRNHLMIQDMLPAGFEAIDMSLATSSKAAAVEASEEDSESDDDRMWWNRYDDVVRKLDFGCNCGFTHQEIHDDMILWSDPWVPAGVYHLRYPVRATTAGTYNSGFATVSAFYEPEVFGRSTAKIYTVKEKEAATH